MTDTLSKIEKRTAYTLLLPAVFLVFAIVLFPIFANIWISFKEVQLKDIRIPEPRAKKIVKSISEDKTKLKIKFNLIQRTTLGFVVGFISSLMGIGGAIMNVPILKFVGYTINKAIGTAASIGFLISIFGTIGFLTTGIMMQKNIPLSTGFINIPAFFIFIPITIIMAKIGATAVHKIKRDLIAKLFGFFLIIIASRFLYEYFNF